METHSNYTYPAGTIFDEISWMSMPPTYYAYPMSTNGQAGYPMAMQHALPYPSMANWCSYNINAMPSSTKYKKKRNLFTKLQLNMLQRRFAEKEHIRQPERDNFAQMIGLTGEQVKIWFQNQRYKRKHRESNVLRHATVTSSSGANTSVSSLSSSSPNESPDSVNSKHIGIIETSAMQQGSTADPATEIPFQHSTNYTKLYWEPQTAYYPCNNFASEYIPNADGKLSLPICTEDELEL